MLQEYGRAGIAPQSENGPITRVLELHGLGEARKLWTRYLRPAQDQGGVGKSCTHETCGGMAHRVLVKRARLTAASGRQSPLRGGSFRALAHGDCEDGILK